MNTLPFSFPPTCLLPDIVLQTTPLMLTDDGIKSKRKIEKTARILMNSFKNHTISLKTLQMLRDLYKLEHNIKNV